MTDSDAAEDCRSGSSGFNVVAAIFENANDLAFVKGAVSVPLPPFFRVAVLARMFPRRDGSAAEGRGRLREVFVTRDHDHENHSGDRKSAESVQGGEALRSGTRIAWGRLSHAGA